MSKQVLLFLLTLVCAAAALRTEAADEYKVLNKYELGGEGGWDYVSIDSTAGRLYVGRGDRVMIVNLEDGKVLAEIPGMAGVHGVALVPELGRGYVSCGKDNSVRVIDLATQKETGKLKATAKPDAIIYEPLTKTVLAFNNGGTTMTVIDPAKNEVTGDVELGGAPEFAVSDGKGKVYVNLEDKSEVVEVDIANRKATNHWTLDPGKSPTGLALDIDGKHLFSGCRETKTMEVMDAVSGKVLASPPIGGGVDATAFDPDSKNAFSSNGDGTLTIVHEDAPDSFKVVQTLNTMPTARTMALDPKTHKIWLVGGTGRNGPKQPFTLICVGK